MRPSPARAVVRRALGTVAVAAVVAVQSLLLVAPASAHDGLSSSSPAAGAALTAAPASVTLSFEETPLAAGLGVVVTGPDGRSVTAGAATVSGTDVVAPLVPVTASGTYSVAWRVVATDGHPSNGTYTFTLTLASPSATPSASGSAPVVTTADPEGSATGSELGDVSHSPGADLTPWMVGGSALLLGVIVVLGVLGVVARRRSG